VAKNTPRPQLKEEQKVGVWERGLEYLERCMNEPRETVMTIFFTNLYPVSESWKRAKLEGKKGRGGVGQVRLWSILIRAHLQNQYFPWHTIFPSQCYGKP
jgi:hypothetical protein